MKKTTNAIVLPVLLGIGLLCSMTMYGCKKDGGDPVQQEVPPTANLMVIHASPDVDGLDILVDGAKANTSVMLFPSATSYLGVAPANHSLKIVATGTTNALIDTSANLVVDKYYSFFVTNKQALIAPIILEDNLTAPESGKAHLRFLHLSPDSPPFDIGFSGEASIFNGYRFKQYSQFTAVDTGTKVLQVRAVGQTTAQRSLNMKLESGKIYTVYVHGLLNGNGAQSLQAKMIRNN